LKDTQSLERPRWVYRIDAHWSASRPDSRASSNRPQQSNDEGGSNSDCC